MANLNLMQKIYIIFWKALILRKRNPILSVCEFLCPLIILYITYRVNRAKGEFQDDVTDRSLKTFTPEDVHGLYVPSPHEMTIAYTPSNAETDQLIRDAANGMATFYHHDYNVTTFGSEEQLETWLVGFSDSDSYRIAVGLVFFEVNPKSKTLKYKIRVSDKSGLVTSETGTKESNPYEESGFLGVQLWIDLMFLNSTGLQMSPRELLIGPLPAIELSISDVLIYFIYIFLSFAYVFFILLLSRNVIQEKETGIKEVSKIMGMSSFMIWSHWLIYAMIVQLPVTVGITVILSVLGPQVLAINPFLVALLFILFTVNCIVLVFAATCLFNNSTKGTTIIVVIWVCLHFATVQHLVQFNADGLGLMLESLACFLLPSFNIVNCFRIILLFEDSNIKWTMDLLFHKGFSSSLSIGISMVIFLLSTCAYALLTLFLDSIHPGPYGVAKPINFMCAWPRRQANDETDGRRSLPKTYEPPPREAKVGIEIRGLQKTYGICKKSAAVRNVDLDIYEGEIMALLGHNGAGKTTTMSMITGMFSPTGGVIRVNGQDINRGGSQFRQSLGLCPQQNIYFPKLTVIEHLRFFAMLKGLPKEYSKVHAMQILTMLGLAEKKNAKVKSLSGGMKRRLCLAVSLSGNPSVLILDEPTSGLDPENRRKIWDIVLSMRGQRTILITTHFMEEADVLGDRIAIMDKGQVVCCGTTMFLKKLYGAGYQVHLLKNSDASARGINQFVNQNYKGDRIKIKVESPTQVAFLLKENNVDSFPALFSALERNKIELGITGISVTCSTMEDVFLNVANSSMFDETLEEKVSNKSITSNRSNERSNRQIDPLSGTQLVIQRILTLILKRFIYLRRNLISFLVILVITSILIGFMANSDLSMRSKEPSEPLKISLDLYPQAVIPIFYDQFSENIAHTAAKYIRAHNVEAELPNGTIDEYATIMAKYDMLKYQTQTLLGLTLDGEIPRSYTVQYQINRGYHLPAVGANMLTNILLLHHSGFGLIETTNHPYTPKSLSVCTDVESSLTFVYFKCWFIFTFVLIIMMMEFVPFVIDERSSGFKHQQFLAGASPMLYWLAAFISDFLIYLSVIVINLIIIAIFGSHLFAWNSKWMELILIVLLLYGISGLLFLYLFTRFFGSVVTGSSFFIAFNMIFGLLAALTMYMILFGLKTSMDFWLKASLYLLMFNPTFSASMCIFYIYREATYAYACEKCEYCQKKVKDILQMPSDDFDGPILLYIRYLEMTWCLYLVVILLIDYGLKDKIKMLFWNKSDDKLEPDADKGDDEDEDVRVERELVRLYRESEDYSVPLRVEGLNKRYCFGPKVVDNVSFAVANGECFGLLGVNGAGKTTTFKMITGEITPDGGDAMILRESVLRHRWRYMRQVGYCPQFDASLACLTGRETLKLMAKLRGVPADQADARVDEWLTSLGFEEHGDKRCAAYSGGTRRKLSTAAAFIGDPVVVFLDEPTTGVDPAARRKLWNVLQARKKAGQSIVMTSHSMEECEALCSRLTILVAGRMVCIGSCEYLKTKFSKGYNVLLKISGNATPLERDAVKRSFSRLFPRAELKDEHQTMVSYQVTDRAVKLSQLFATMVSLKTEQGALEDFSVSNTTLEQLFLSFAQQKTPNRK